MELSWLGHATVRIGLDGTTVMTDPALRRRISGLVRHAPLPAPQDLSGVDVVLISHAHHDHLDLPSLRMLGWEVPIFVSRGAGTLLESAGMRNVREFEVGDRATVGDLRITAVPAQHAGRRMPFGPWAVAIGFLVEGSQSVYFAGDTALFPEMDHIHASLDVALLPVGGWGPRLRGGHLDPPAAAEALTLLRPRRALAIHWGTLWPAGMRRVGSSRFTEPGREFRESAARVAPDVEVVSLSPGERLDLGTGRRGVTA